MPHRELPSAREPNSQPCSIAVASKAEQVNVFCWTGRLPIPKCFDVSQSCKNQRPLPANKRQESEDLRSKADEEQRDDGPEATHVPGSDTSSKKAAMMIEAWRPKYMSVKLLANVAFNTEATQEA